MKLFLKKAALWLVLTYQSILTNIAVALKNVDDDILRSMPIDVNDSNKKITRKLHRNLLLEKFYAGKKDVKYQKEYYEILKKSDKFLKFATKHKMDVAIDRWKLNIGKEDLDGNVLDHVGFFDPKHKYQDKKLGDMIEIEKKERKTDDDNYELLEIYDNKPIELGLKDVTSISDINSNMSKKFKFPLKIDRDNRESINKIEELTETLHVKKIGFEHRSLEFFIPSKFGVSTHVKNNSEIFNELIDIRYVYLNEKYGDLIGYTIEKYYKHINFRGYDVLKFYAKEMKIV